MIFSQEELNIAFLTSLFSNIQDCENQELRRFFCITPIVIVTGSIPVLALVYTGILIPLFFNFMGMLYSLRTIKQKKQFLEQYLKQYIYWNLKCQY